MLQNEAARLAGGRKTGCQYGGTDSFKGSFQEGPFSAKIQAFKKRWILKAIKGTYKDGRVELSEPVPDGEGPVEVLVVFPDVASDPWQSILEDSRPRPIMEQWMNEVEKEIAEGKAEPLDPNKL
jgi:hypothetical protein